jgi:hypothetical protein
MRTQLDQFQKKIFESCTVSEDDSIIYVDTTFEAIKIFIDTPLRNDTIKIIDLGNASTNSITISSNKTINGSNKYVINEDNAVLEIKYNIDSDNYLASKKSSNQFTFVFDKYDLPKAVNGVINLVENATYFFLDNVDLLGDRIICAANNTILGGSSENCRIKSTGLVGTALITSVYSLPIRNITIEADVALNLDGDGTTTALDWFGVNFTDCGSVGTIKDYSNFIMADSAFLNSGGLTFDGTIGTIGISQCLFNCSSANTVFTLPATLTVTRRFRIIYSSFVVLSGETGINIDASATIPTESYILDTINFSGGGTYLSGVDDTSNKSLFVKCVGITNTAVNGQIYMQGNASATTISVTNTFYKVSGTTSASSDNQKYTASDNRLTNNAAIERKYLISCNLSFTSGNNKVCEFGFYDSKLSAIRTPSRTKSTSNGSGRAENISFSCVVNHSENDYLEIWCSNTTDSANITVTDMNFVITEII